MAQKTQFKIFQATVVLFLDLIDDKDTFLKLYEKLAGLRLMNDTSASRELEEGLLAKLCVQDSFETISKIKQMFVDIDLSDDLSQEFVRREKELIVTAAEQRFSLRVPSTLISFFSNLKDILGMENGSETQPLDSTRIDVRKNPENQPRGASENQGREAMSAPEEPAWLLLGQEQPSEARGSETNER